jgi:hypothetical protein
MVTYIAGNMLDRLCIYMLVPKDLDPDHLITGVMQLAS